MGDMDLRQQIQNTPSPERDKMDCAFLRMQAHYLDTAETKWPYVNSATAIGETARRVANRMEKMRAATETGLEWLRSLEHLGSLVDQEALAGDIAKLQAALGVEQTPPSKE